MVPKGARKLRWGFMQPVRPDRVLSEITGDRPLTRSEVTRLMWQYIRQHGLQDDERKVLIRADEKLRPLFGGRQAVTILEMFKLVSGHLKLG